MARKRRKYYHPAPEGSEEQRRMAGYGCLICIAFVAIWIGWSIWNLLFPELALP
jgi:hypothetical protein